MKCQSGYRMYLLSKSNEQKANADAKSQKPSDLLRVASHPPPLYLLILSFVQLNVMGFLCAFPASSCPLETSISDDCREMHRASRRQKEQRKRLLIGIHQISPPRPIVKISSPPEEHSASDQRRERHAHLPVPLLWMDIYI